VRRLGAHRFFAGDTRRREPAVLFSCPIGRPGGPPAQGGRAPAKNRNFIFHYPFAGTPCFLLNLGKPTKPSAQLKTRDEQTYEWPGGVGAGHSIVAYSAICAHRLTYPTREISFISYRGEKSAGSRFAQVIHCCSEHSQYDPAEGAKVLAGPAPQPLAAILLEHDPTSDGLFAVGTWAGSCFNEFFSKYESASPSITAGMPARSSRPAA